MSVFAYRIFKEIFVIALLASNLYFVSAQDSPITGGYSVSSYLSDSGNVYWHTGGMGGSIGAYTKVLKGDQPGNATPYLNKIRAISANAGNSMLFLACDSTVYTSNSGTAAHVLKGAQSPNTSGFLEKITYVTGWNLGNFALQSDGKVLSWGSDNAAGQLGNGTTTPSATPTYVLQGPAPGTPLTGVIQIQGMENNGVALKSDGTVWIWGSNSNEQLGVCGAPNSLYAVQVGGLPQIVKISAGDANLFALGVDGYLYAWGRGSSYAGMLALASGNTADICIPERVAAVGSTTPTTSYLTGVVDFEAGQIVAIALLDDGTLVHWGGGTNSSTPSIPQVVLTSAGGPPLTGIEFVGAGDDKLMAMKADGTLYEWMGGYPTLITPKPYKKSLGCPDAYLGPDVTLCNPLSETLYAGSQSPTYMYRWYLNGTLISDPALSYATGPYVTINAPGTYKVVITDTSALRLLLTCPCLPDSDQVVITTNSEVPINGTFCTPPNKQVTIGVSDPGNTFDWYAAATGGSPLAGGTATNTFLTPFIGATTTYYAQDTRTYNYPNASGYLYPPTQSGLSAASACVPANQIPSTAAFTVQQTLTLVSVDVYKSGTGGCTGGVTTTTRIEIQTLTAPASTGTVISSQFIPVTLNCDALNTVPLNVVLAPGYYKLKWNNTSNVCSFNYYGNASYPSGVAGVVSFYDADAGNFGVWTSSFFNWNITATHSCGRIPVQAILTSSCPLPVDFISFEAQKISGDVQLNWFTSDPKGNNHFFEIERSSDGITFQVIGRVEAKSGLNTDYSFIDQSISSPLVYYRIKQYDKDGQFIYSQTRSVTDEFALEVTVFPNPSENDFSLNISDLSNGEFKGEVYSSIGTIVETFNGKTNNSIHFGSNLSSGCYTLKLIIGNGAPRVVKICKL